MLKNMRLTFKLLLLFIPTIIALIGLLVFYAIEANSINSASKQALYDDAYLNTVSIMQAEKDMYRAQISDKVLYYTKDSLRDEDKAAMVKDFNTYSIEAHDLVEAAMNNLMEDTELYNNYKHPTVDTTLAQLSDSFHKNFDAWVGAYDLNRQSGNMGLRFAQYDLTNKDLALMSELLRAYANERSENILSDTKAAVTTSVTFLSVIILLIIVLGVFIIIYLKSGFKYITGISTRIAYGELSVNIDKKRCSKDEVGQMVKATGQILSRLNDYVAYIEEIAFVLDKMSKGDMRIELKQEYVGEFEVIKNALNNISASLNQTLSQINEAAAQVNTSASQVSDAAQALAAGSTEQATSAEQLAATISEVSSQVSDNAKNASKAKELAVKASMEVEHGNDKMKNMITAMSDISNSSNQINKIIKVIDDIAFQTNILALNAAVEAARAGGAGKGFAVVADEVRNLAGKSAEAAKTTASLIENSISKVNEGMKLADTTASSLNEIVNSVNETSSLIDRIDKASAQQATALHQLTEGISQISSVIQTNSATAEQIAATSQELSGQSSMLKKEVGRFVLSDSNPVTAIEPIDYPDEELDEDFDDIETPPAENKDYTPSKYFD